eukprot:4925-Chlamydomonas_euryale.AAC.2
MARRPVDQNGVDRNGGHKSNARDRYPSATPAGSYSTHAQPPAWLHPASPSSHASPPALSLVESVHGVLRKFSRRCGCEGWAGKGRGRKGLLSG